MPPFRARALALALTFAGAANVADAQTWSDTTAPVPRMGEKCLFNDSHFHLTNYVQEGPPLRDVLKLQEGRVCRSTVFGIPLQQQWSHRVTGDRAPLYYMDSDAHLYYYSFSDADIAVRYKALSKAEQARLDPMITGFNPTDMYAADHVRRVLATYPGVFVGVGEFSVHKEFVSGKVAGDVASLLDPALHRLLGFAGEVGLVTILHNDVIMPYTKAEAAPLYFRQLVDALKQHPGTTIIWAHVGLGRVVQPPAQFRAFVEEILTDPALSHVYFDLSWDEAAKYIVRDQATVAASASVINAYPDRFLFGTDVVAPKNANHYFSVYQIYQPLWDALTPEAREKVLKTNYQRLFDAARLKVRAWETANVAGAP